MDGLLFEWDEAKAVANEDKHGLSFTNALPVFLDRRRADYDVSRPQDGEVRRKVVGRLDVGFVTIVYTLRGDTIRIISARRANAGEERSYGHR